MDRREPGCGDVASIHRQGRADQFPRHDFRACWVREGTRGAPDPPEFPAREWALRAATIAPDQMEIALFGEEDSEGRTTRIGLFEKAHNGTLLLDEVADMPLGTQNKILRVLTEQRFQRVGGKSDVSVDVRVMSATTKDIRHEISEGRFREDLYYRLSVVPLRVPSLAERRDDIGDLVTYFTNRIADSSGLTPRTFSAEAMAVLQSMDWPGNIRQLRNAGAVRAGIPRSADHAVQWEYLPNGRIHRHGAFGLAQKIKGFRRKFESYSSGRLRPLRGCRPCMF